MRTSKKILSVVLALVMVFSAFGAALAVSAADEKAYSPSYSGTSKETVNVIIDDARTLVDNTVWTGLINPMLNGSLIQTVYGLYPSLEGFKGLAGLDSFEFTKGSCYKALAPEIFADLDADASVSTESLAAYFADHPIQADGDAFWTELAKAIYPLGTSSMLGGNIANILVALDNLLTKLGLDVPHPSFEFANIDANGVPQTTVSARRATSIEASGDMMFSILSIPEYGDFGTMTAKERGDAYVKTFGGAESALNVKTESVGNQQVAMVQVDNGKAVRPGGTMDYMQVNDAAITVSVTDLYGATYTFEFTNPYAGKTVVAVDPTPIVYADGTAADVAKLPAQINSWGEVCDSQGNLLYGEGSSTVLSVSRNADQTAAGIASYLQAILPVLQQDTVGTLLGAIRTFSDPAARVAFHEFTVELQRGVGIMTALVIALGQVPVEGYNLATLMVDLQFFLNKLPEFTEDVTIGGQKQMATDFTALLNDITQVMRIVPAKDEDGNTKLDEAGKVVLEPLGITFAQIDSSKLDPAMDDADTLMVVYQYLFSNLIGNKDNLNAIATLLKSFNLDISSYLDMVQGLDPNAVIELVAPILHGMVYPALVDEATGVKVEVNGITSTIVPGAVLKVEALTSGEAYDKLVAALKAGDVSYDKLQAFDLKLMAGEEEVQPDGTVKVSIPLPEGFDTAKCAIYRMEADGSVTKMDVTVEEGTLVFITDRLSQYAVVELKEVVTEPTTGAEDTTGEEGTTGGSTTDTGDVAIGAVAMITLAAGAAFVLSRKKKA